MKRLKDWRTRLHKAVEDRRRVPFSFEAGVDCALFVSDCIEAMTGEDPAAEFRGRYTTDIGALRILRNEGHATLADAVAARLEEIHPSRAGVGDVAAVPTDSPFGWALGMFIGEQVIAQDLTGLATFSRDAAIRAFRVP
ncbi:MAG: hypothetical protein FD152_1211 [Xanthobacteraceae bacterium]|nr:MAG: hypothetical protein FD152_1211 [Xanthobacteraceae bacterium]